MGKKRGQAVPVKKEEAPVIVQQKNSNNSSETNSKGGKAAPKAKATEGGGISWFNLFTFFIATTSIGINVAIIYGAVPLQGTVKFILERYLEQQSHVTLSKQIHPR